MVCKHPMAGEYGANFTWENGKTIMTTSAIPVNETEEERTTFERAFDGMTQGFMGTFDQ